MRTFAVYALLALASAAVPAFPQTPAATAPKYVSLIGTIEKVDTAASSLSVKPDKADASTVKFDSKTQFLRLPAGETDTKKATRGAATDIAAGDRVVARLHAEDPSGMPAAFLYFTKQSDLAQRQQKTLEEWQSQGVAGTVKTVDPGAKQATITVRSAGGPPRDVTLDLGGAVDFQRYSPDSGKYESSTLAQIQAGDQVRVLGQKNADQTSIKVEAIMSGAFKTVPVQIKSIDTAANTILATDLATKKPVSISIKPDTTMKKLDEATALLMARRLNPTFQGGGGGRGGRGGAAPDSAGDATPQGASPAAGGFAGRGGGGRGQGQGGQGQGGPGGGRGGRNLDQSKLLEQQPTITLADLKAGEPVVVTGAASNDMSRLTAMTLVAGVDPILRAAPQNGPDPLGGNWSFGEIGGGGQ